VQAAAARILAIARKEFVHISRDWRMIVAVLVMPLLQLLLFGYAISFDVRNVPTVVLDQDNTPASRAYIAAAGNSGFFRIVGAVPDQPGVDSAFDRNTARAAIVISRGYGDALARGGKGQVAVLVDGSEPNSAQLGQAYATALNNNVNRAALVTWAAARGSTVSGVGQLEPRIRDWYNPGHKSADFLVPGLMVVIIMIVTVQQTSVTLVREREDGTAEQMLISPLKHGELVLGKVAPWAALGFIDTLIITVVSLAVFQVPLRGDLSILAVGMFLFILCSLSLGLIISAAAPSIESANMIGLIIAFLPGFMLSGLAFPLASVPWVLQMVSYLFPARYMVEIARGVFLRGTGWDVMWLQVVWLVVYAVVGLTIATLLNRGRAA
jgi:ABC-2 type transport system permease protein